MPFARYFRAADTFIRFGPGRTFCAHAPGAVEPLGSAIKYFREEFEAGVAPGTAPRRDAVQTAGA